MGEKCIPQRDTTQRRGRESLGCSNDQTHHRDCNHVAKRLQQERPLVHVKCQRFAVVRVLTKDAQHSWLCRVRPLELPPSPPVSSLGLATPFLNRRSSPVGPNPMPGMDDFDVSGLSRPLLSSTPRSPSVASTKESPPYSPRPCSSTSTLIRAFRSRNVL